MNRQRLLYLALAALLVLGAAFLLNARRNVLHDEHDTLLLPSLAQNLNAVTGVTLRHGAAAPSVTLHKQGTQWSVAERNDYPVDVVKLRKLLLALSEAKIVEEKTADPAKFAGIGVDDPAQTGAIGTEVALTGLPAPSGIIVGKTAGQGNFVRRVGGNTSYVIEPALSIDATPAAWLDNRVLDVPSASIQSLEFKPAAGPGYVLHRATPDGAFALTAVPAGRKALDGAALTPSPNTLANLTAEDVAPAAGLDFTHADQVIVTLGDGGVLTLTGAADADKHWLQIKSSKDQSLNTKLDGRALSVAGYRYDSIFRPLDRLLEPLPPPAPKPGAKSSTLPHAPPGPPTPRTP
jgi:Domain of unknown function (DUF4340)